VYSLTIFVDPIIIHVLLF
jgi:formin-binding protein 4